MNYGKLAYTELKDTNARVEYLEKNKHLNYANAGSSQTQVASQNFITSDKLYFTLKISTPLLVEISIDSTASNNTNCEIELFLDDASIHKQIVELSAIDTNKLLRVNVNDIKNGDHVIYMNIVQSEIVVNSINITCFASGITRDKSKSMIRLTTVNDNLILAKKNGNTMELYSGGKLICIFYDTIKFDIIAINSTTFGVARINTKKQLYYSVFSECIINNVLIDINVDSFCVCDCNTKYNGYFAYVKNGEIYFFELLSKTYFPKRKIDIGIKSIKEVNFIRNSLASPIILAIAKNKNSYIISCVDDIIGKDIAKTLAYFNRA